jgi:hypothetical protein
MEGVDSIKHGQALSSNLHASACDGRLEQAIEGAQVLVLRHGRLFPDLTHLIDCLHDWRAGVLHLWYQALPWVLGLEPADLESHAGE